MKYPNQHQIILKLNQKKKKKNKIKLKAINFFLACKKENIKIV